MKRQIPLAIVFVMGVVMAVQYFVPHDYSEFLYEYALDWVIVIGIFAIALGLWSLVRVTWRKVQRRQEGWGYSVITLLGLGVMLIAGPIWGIEEGTIFMRFFWHIYTPIQATMFSLLAFFIASAAYRAFRVRSAVATILLVTALVIMLRMVPLGPISAINQLVVGWILAVPNMAAKRAIAIGVGLGGIATAIKIVAGIERSYLGRD
jgi:hypothetical protein